MNPPERLERLLDSPVIDVQQPTGGHTRSWRGMVTTEAGTRVFVKAAADERTARSLRTEHSLYAALEADWLPVVWAWEDGPEPILILEDLSKAQWPPPWPAESSILFPTLTRIADTRVPFDLEAMPPLEVSPWSEITADPAKITGLGIVDLEWIARHGTRLIELSSKIDLSGDDLIHADLGAGNLCFTKRGPVIVDWEYVSRGNRYLDVATALLDMRACHAPTPHVLPQPAAWASVLAGLMGIHASRPPPDWAADGTELRRLQRQLAKVAVEWVAELEGW
ncbi:MAG: phosphotransferase [Acidimicrobiia bacterium]|nr:phosphotransferase [Acidimicrobiia bacterium]